jgi:hypothetical protein
VHSAVVPQVERCNYKGCELVLVVLVVLACRSRVRQDCDIWSLEILERLIPLSLWHKSSFSIFALLNEKPLLGIFILDINDLLRLLVYRSFEIDCQS